MNNILCFIKIIIRLSKLIRTDFNINVTKLISGSITSSCIFFLTLPVLSRLYTPEAFGSFQKFLSFSAVLSCWATFSFQSAIPIPRKQAEAARLALIPFISLATISLILLMLTVILPQDMTAHLRLSDITQGMLYLPLIVFMTGLVLISEHVLVREKEFMLLSVTRLSRSILTQGGAWVFAFYTSSYLGLLASYFIGLSLSFFLMFSTNMRFMKQSILSWEDMRSTIVKFKKFPLLDTPSVLITTIANELPIIMMTIYHTEQNIGVYMIAFRLIKAPLSIFSTAFFEVYYQKCSELFLSNRKEVNRLFVRTAMKMGLVSGCFFIIILACANLLSYLYLGNGWSETAVVMRILVVWVAVESVYNSISASFLVTNKLEILFTLNCTLLIVRLIVMYLFRADPMDMLISLSVVSAILYIIYLYCAYHVIKEGKDD